MKYKVIFLSLAVLIALSVAPIFASSVHAANPGGEIWTGGFWGPIIPCSGTECTICHFIELVQNLAYFGISLVIYALTPILVAVGGIMIMFSMGSTTKLEQGKKILTGALVGLAIALGSFIILGTFFTILGATFGDGNSRWASISCPLNQSIPIEIR